MIIGTICVHGVRAVPVSVQPIPKKIDGAQIRFEYADPMWDGLSKTVVFRAGDVTKDVLNAGELVKIPPEVLTEVGEILKVGVYGEGIPTLWADLGRIRDATDPSGDESTDPTLPVWEQLQEQIDDLKKAGVSEEKIAQIVSEYLQKNPPTVTETDPTVPDWAKNEKKPTYTAAEVGALPNTYTPPNQTAEQVGADPKGTAASAVSQHNTADDSHGDIRLELKAINDRLTAFFDSDNQTLDELSEIVAYITSNKSLIDSITTSKVSVSDIINNLSTNVSNKPLSSAQGVALKGLIDAVSNKLANYQPKGNYLTEVPEGYAKTSEIPKKPEDIGAQPAGNYLTEVPDGYAKTDDIPTDAEIIQLIKDNAPESSGGGIAVTGAKVGQTVKIAEVDDNGVPTAWESVDFPSGGGGGVVRMHLITDFTTTEDLTKIVISEDKDGKPFSLSKMAVRGYITGGESGGYIGCGVNDKGFYTNMQLHANSKRDYIWYAELNNDGTINGQYGGGNSGTFSGISMTYNHSYHNYGDNITSVYFQTGTNAQLIATGSRFVIYGA